MKYEYEVMLLAASPQVEDQSRRINWYADRGWRLIAVSGGYAYFERTLT